MSDLSLLVRLNQNVSVRPPSLPAGGGPQSMPNVLLLVGEVGEGTIFTGSYSSKKSFFMKTHSKETHRDSVKKRIRNPDDPSQHVDVLDVKKHSSKAGSGQQYEIRDVQYHPLGNQAGADGVTDTVDGQPVGPDPSGGGGGGE